ncbi:hypothetical protein OXX59_004935 [Metschnikowia pulcherrima]
MMGEYTIPPQRLSPRILLHTMAPKRNIDSMSSSNKKSSKKSQKSRAANAYEALRNDRSKNEAENDIVLVDSSDNDSHSDGIVIVSDDSDTAPQTEKSAAKKKSSSSKPARKRQKLADPGNEVSGNNDFIGFGFSSSENEEDDDGEYDDEGYAHPPGETRSAFPWVQGQSHSTQKEIADWLTLEIKDFVNYISPSKDEIVVRNTVIANLKRHIASFWPETQAHVFGSCATDLYLPGSDIDMVVISTTGDYEQRSRLYQLSSYLRTHKLAKNIEVIASAKVPIIKFVDPQFNIHVDVSFERTNGIDAARRIRRWLDTNPGLRELVLIVKQFLRSRMLNNVHVGGLGGYATIIMVYHFLKMHPRVSTGNIAPMENLGTLLIEFFELYGRNFSYDNLIIALDPKDDSPKYLKKYRYPSLNTGRGQFTIIIQDPSDPDNNITRSSYNLRDLKKAFGGAYQLLTAKCYELNSAAYKNRIGQSILGDIITYRGKDRDFNDDRDKVVNSALISHESSEESDGADGNDKYYFSDMTAESDAETYVTPDMSEKGKIVANSVSKSSEKVGVISHPTEVVVARSKNDKTAVNKRSNGAVKSKASGKKVEDFMSIESESEDEKNSGNKPATNLEKDTKRDFWKSKGLEPQ